MEEHGDLPPSLSQPLTEPSPSPHPSPFPKNVSRKGLLRQQATRLKMGMSLSPIFRASSTSRLPSKGRKKMTTIPETRAIRQRLTYGLLTDISRCVEEGRPTSRRDGCKKGENSYSKRKGGGGKFQRRVDATGKKDLEEEAFEDCLEEEELLDSSAGAEKKRYFDAER